MAGRELGPRQRGKKGNESYPTGDEHIPGSHGVAPEDAGRDVTDEEAGVRGILRKADDESRPALTDDGNADERAKRWIIAPET